MSPAPPGPTRVPYRDPDTDHPPSPTGHQQPVLSRRRPPAPVLARLTLCPSIHGTTALPGCRVSPSVDRPGSTLVLRSGIRGVMVLPAHPARLVCASVDRGGSAPPVLHGLIPGEMPPTVSALPPVDPHGPVGSDDEPAVAGPVTESVRPVESPPRLLASAARSWARWSVGDRELGHLVGSWDGE